MIPKKDDIFLDITHGTPVRVIGSSVRRDTARGFAYHFPVRAVLTDKTYFLTRSEMSTQVLNEMEVIAWSALRTSRA